MNTRTTQTNRRGMVLLIVIVLLTTFSITALTFLLSTGQVKSSAEQNRNMGQQAFYPQALLNEAVMQVIRGTDNGDSDIGENSLLDDMYETNEGDQVSLTATGSLDANGMIRFTGGKADYAGRVVTCIDRESSKYGCSTVIVKVEGNAMYALPLTDGSSFEGAQRQYLINGRPFQEERDYDACDDRNMHLAARNPVSGQILYSSFDHAAGNYQVDSDNDGLLDSNWLDLGLPPRAAADGTMYKPMFAIIVEDMDGRLNVNAQGDKISRDCGNCAMTHSIGLGRGPAEISLRALPNWSNLIDSRTGDTSPDYTTTSDHKGNWYKIFTTTIGESDPHRTPYDIRGILGISMPSPSKGTPTYTQKSTGTAQVGGSSPYDRDLGPARLLGVKPQSGVDINASRDRLYSPAELEALLRPYDFDSPFLPNRLWDLMGITPSDNDNATRTLRNTITTESWDIPVICTEELGEINGQTTEYLPEIFAGIPIDMMRAASWNATDDVWDGSKYPRRHLFAKTIYNILEKREVDMGGRSGASRQEHNAQWAVNVVDFLDADSVMTPFQYETGKYVFGVERPELLITETLAMHSRNTEPECKDKDGNYVGGKKGSRTNKKHDTTVYETDTPDSIDEIDDETLTPEEKATILKKMDDMEKAQHYDKDEGEDDFDQQIRPQGSLFIEVYSPWTEPGTNDEAKFIGASKDIYDANGNIDLTKKQGDNSVWRMVIGTGNTPANMGAERVVNFGNSSTAPGLNVQLIHKVSATGLSLEPGKRALLGPEGSTVLSFSRSDGTHLGDEASVQNAVQREIVLTDTVKKFDEQSPKNLANLVCLPVQVAGNDARFSLTEKSGTYGTKMCYTKPYDEPLDKGNAELYRNGFQQKYRYVYLQRLADPNRAWNENSNPYLTIDMMEVDLNVFNARSSESENGVSGSLAQIKSRVRKNADGVSDDVALLWRPGSTLSTGRGNGLTSQNTGEFNKEVWFGFGGWGMGGYASNADGTLTKSVPWLCFLNRPPVSPLELMNVTNQSAESLWQEIKYDTGTTSGFLVNSGLSGHLPNFLANNRKCALIFGYMRCPTPQLVTPYVKTPAGATAENDYPFAYYSMYREPGKINLNTIYSQDVFEGLIGRIGTTNGSQTWSKFLTSRGGSTTNPCAVTTPFRSLVDGVNSSFLRTDCLYESDTSSEYNTSQHPYFRYMQYYRLANLATTRSNVYAVWITMGLFEVDSNGNVNMNREMGEVMGNEKRYRSFYLIDRTIPVGFERGQNHNADKTILVRRMLP